MYWVTKQLRPHHHLLYLWLTSSSYSKNIWDIPLLRMINEINITFTCIPNMIDFIEDECLGITIPNISQFNLFYHSNATLFKPRINYKKPYEFISRFRQFFRHCIRSVFVLSSHGCRCVFWDHTTHMIQLLK